MNRKEFYNLFEIEKPIESSIIDTEEAELYWLSMLEEGDKDFIKSVLLNYKSILGDELKGFLESNLTSYISDNKDPNFYEIFVKILMKDRKDRHFDYIDLLERISKSVHVVEAIFIPSLYYLSYVCANKRITNDCGEVLTFLEVLIGFENVRKYLENRWVWGLESRKHECVMFSSFEYPFNTSCFIDGFLEPFLYKRQKYNGFASLFYKKSNSEINHISCQANNGLEMLCDGVYNVLLSLITYSPQIKLNFMDYIILVVSANEKRGQIMFDYFKVMSDGFSYNLAAVMGKFCKNIISRNMFDKIDASYAFELRNTSFSSLVFFSKMKLSYFSVIKFFEYIKDLYYDLGRLNSENELIVEEKKRLQSKIICLESVISSEHFRYSEQNYFNFTTAYILRNGFDFPEYFFQTYLQMHDHLLTIQKDSDSENLLKVLENIIRGENTYKHHVVSIISCRAHVLKFTMINFIIDYYNLVQKEDSRFNIRNRIHGILKENESFRKLRICRRNIKFVNSMMGDFEIMLSDGLGSISELKDLKVKLAKLSKEMKGKEEIVSRSYYTQELSGSLNQARKELLELEFRVLNKENQVKNCFFYVKGCLHLLDHIVDANPDILIVDELIGSFVNILNCNLKIIVGPKCSSLRIENSEKYNFDAKDLLRRILLIYLKVRSEKFIQHVSHEEMYFDIKLFYKSLEIVESKYILNKDQCDELRELIKKLETSSSNKKVDDVVSEFLDPLTYNPITDPVKLLTSNITVDRTTYNLIMLNDGVDPFNRIPLTDSNVVVDEEMKKKILESNKGKQ